MKDRIPSGRAARRTFAAALAALLFAFALAPLGHAVPQQGAQLEVGLRRELVKVGEPTEIFVRLSTTSGSLPELRFGPLPKVDGVEFGRVQSGARSSRMVRDSRGRILASESVNYLVPLQVTRPGEYEIPPLSLVVGGEPTTGPLEPMRLKVVADIAAEEILLFERDPLPETVYEGEPFSVTIRFGWLKSLSLGDIALHLPWWGRLDGVLELERIVRGREADVPIRSGAVNVTGAERLGVVKRGEDEFNAFRIERRYVATRAGTLDLSGSILEVVEQRRGSFRGKAYYRPLDDATIDVLPIPEEGRPFDFTGAVGTIIVSADAKNRDVDAGDVIPFQLTYSGTGNLEFFDAPKLDRQEAFDRFRVLGVREESSAYERTITYDLIPLEAGIEEIPSVELPYFDPRAKSFERLRSKPIPIQVRAGADGGVDPFGGTPEAEPIEDVVAVRDIDATPVAGERDAGPEGSTGPSAKVSLALLLIGLVGSLVLRGRVRDASDPAVRAARQRRRALGALTSDLRSANDPADRTAALEAFLGARTGTSPESWIGVHDLGPERAERAPEAAQEFAQLRDALDAARFGDGNTNGTSAGDVERVARRLVQEGAV